MQRFSVAITENRQSILRFTREPFGFSARFLQANDRGISRFLCRHIFAGAFAENLRGLRYVENVVDDLESESQPLPESCDRGKSSSIRIGAHRAQTHRASQNRSGLILVN